MEFRIVINNPIILKVEAPSQEKAKEIALQSFIQANQLKDCDPISIELVEELNA